MYFHQLFHFSPESSVSWQGELKLAWGRRNVESRVDLVSNQGDLFHFVPVKQIHKHGPARENRRCWIFLQTSAACKCSCFGEKQRELMAGVIFSLFRHLSFFSDRSTALTRIPKHEDWSLLSKGQDETVIPKRAE